MNTQYSVFIAAVASAVVQAICTVALEKLGNIDLVHAAEIALVPSVIILIVLLASPYLGQLQRWMGERRFTTSQSNRTARSHQMQLFGSETKGAIPITREAVRNEGLFDVLSQLGLAAVTSKLSDSPVTPDACIAHASRALSFLGVLGSKWVNDPPVRAKFSAFLGSVEARQGHVKFCLINPWGPAYKKLHGFRGGNISWESLRHFRELRNKYPCLEVRLYDALPSFRLILVDERICVVARYKIDERGYFESKYGWEAPHLSFLADANWSLYDPFSSYFEEFWSKAKSIDRFNEQLG